MDLTLVFLAIFFSFLFHFATQYIFIKQKRFDNFNHRTSHRTVATRTGGISIFCSFFLISLAYYFLKIDLFDYSLFIPLGILFIIGVYDDLYQADFKVKFLMQLIVAKILIDQGFILSNLYGFLGIYEIPWLFSQIVTALAFVIIVNAYNFIDGIDGLAISETIKNLCLFLYLFSKNDPFYDMAKILLFICIPFYFFNFRKRKKVFLGDAGSLFLGGVNIVLLLHLLNPAYVNESIGETNKILLAFVILFYPILDLIRVVIIRLKNKKSPFTADQNHIHHHLISKGLSHKQATILITSVGIVLQFFILYL
ncbi:MAG: glycosyltransferase family 4 protein [Flavobacteriaceae bacterium]